MIFNKALSAESVKAIYENRTDLILSQETTLGDTWQACMTPNDGTEDGTTLCSNNLTIQNQAPTQDNPLLNATSVANLTVHNLTVFNLTTADADEETVKNIINWYRDSSPIMLINMPFEGVGENEDSVAVDYSSLGNNGTPNNDVTWSRTAGYDGRGAYIFDGIDDFICLDTAGTCGGSDTNSFLDGRVDDRTVELWFKANDNSSEQVLYEEGGATNGLNIYISDGNVYVGIYAGSYGWTAAFHSAPINKDQWYHVVNRMDGNGTFDMYLDGALINSTVSEGIILTHTGDDAIGAMKGDTMFVSGAKVATSGYYFNGTIDNFRVYNISLSAGQINALYNNHTDFIHRTKSGRLA
jgi:hypothetical protein